MTEIIDLVQNLQEIFKHLKKINASIKDDISRLEADPNEIFDAIESFKVEKKATMEKIRLYKDNIEDLKSKMFQLNQNIPKIEIEVQNLSHEKDDYQNKTISMKEKLEELQTEKLKYEGEIDRKTQIINTLELELNNSWNNVEAEIKKISKINENINQEKIKLKEEYKNKFEIKEEVLKKEIETINTENQCIYNKHLDELNSLKLKVNALDILIHNEMINTELFNFIKGLEKNKEMELAFFCQMINFNPEKGAQIIKKMVTEGGPIKFEESSGMILLEKEVGFK